ncbi:MAG: SsrA-binding protein SmpB [Patescibacteria group bacterium]
MPPIAVNKNATFDYEIAEKFSAGVELTGHEAKSAKRGRFDLSGARVNLRGGEAWLVGTSIPSFQPGNTPAEYDVTRSRKLLLKKDELLYLDGKLKSGLTLVPLCAYTNRGFLKIELGLGRMRKKYDKREAIKKRDMERDLRRLKPNEH